MKRDSAFKGYTLNLSFWRIFIEKSRCSCQYRKDGGLLGEVWLCGGEETWRKKTDRNEKTITKRVNSNYPKKKE
jgi:hypothetical protein